jgi:beta-N-acetylhexosaminidase
MKHTFLFIILTCFFNFNAFSAESFDSWYKSLSDNEKISQLFVTGVKSKALSSKERSLLKKWPVGGVIYFKRNYKNPNQFLKLHNEILSTTGSQPFTFTDQEGGDVVRIGTAYDSPTPLAVGMLKSKKVTNYLGQAYGSLLADLGISVNLAPVVDIRSKDSLDFISTRSLSSSPETVSDLSLELSRGMLASGVIPTLKHFPGLGGVKIDSHKKVAFKKSTLKEIKKRDWMPYTAHSKAKLPFFVMTSHTQLVLDNKDYGVVTYSKPALTLLRESTSQDQVTITDDLEMGGAKIKTNFEQAAYKSFMAGHDLILIGWSGDKLFSSLEYFKANLNKDDFQIRIKESLKRIYALKQKRKSFKKTASKFTKHGSLKLTSVLNSKISEYLLDKQVSKIIFRAPSSSGDYHYFSSDKLFRKKLSGLNNSSLLTSSNKLIESTCMVKTCILHMTGKKSEAKINDVLKASFSKNIIVLNSADPEMILKENDSKAKVISSYTRSYSLSRQIQKLLEGKSSNNKKRPLKKVALFE